jgi:glycosyltransferase involved in cell wall biosynthesis
MHIWMIKDGEPLPIDSGERLLRAALLAQRLNSRGIKVTWFSGRFSHSQKRFREGPATQTIDPLLTLELLDGPGYTKNLSLKRIMHQRALARAFEARAPKVERPDLVLASYPSPELCLAGANSARCQRAPLIVDVRDPWPDSFSNHFAPPLRILIAPLVAHYRRILRSSITQAVSVVSMSQGMLDWALGIANRTQSEKDAVFYLGYPEARTPQSHVAVPEQFSAQSPLQIVYIGMFGASYDGEALIEAVKQLADRGLFLKLTLAGDGPERAKWENAAQDHNAVAFTGWLSADEIGELLNRSHVGVVPLRGGITSYWMGNKLFEYTSRSLAVISSATSEAAELITRNAIGKSLSNGSAESLAGAIEYYYTNPRDLAETMKRSGELFNSSFKAERLYERYTDHLLNIATCALPHAKNSAKFDTARVPLFGK